MNIVAEAIGGQRVRFLAAGGRGAPDMFASCVDILEGFGLSEKERVIGGNGVHEPAAFLGIFLDDA
jgi:hypothetical protein